MASRVIFACLFVLLAACTPRDEVGFGFAPARVRVDGFNLDVFRRGDRFEVVAATRHLRSERDFVYTAILTAERMTGCAVRRDTVSGGPRRIRGRLDC